MNTLKQDNRTIQGFLRDERGATAIEYALIAAGIAAVIITAVNSLGDSVRTMYATISAAL
jgi:pilus assembly protein Flp/PilA